MTNSNHEWQKAKADQMIRAELKSIAETQCPSWEYAYGMIELAYATGLFDDVQVGYWRQSVDNAVDLRRQELRNQRHANLLSKNG